MLVALTDCGSEGTGVAAAGQSNPVPTLLSSTRLPSDSSEHISSLPPTNPVIWFYHLADVN